MRLLCILLVLFTTTLQAQPAEHYYGTDGQPVSRGRFFRQANHIDLIQGWIDYPDSTVYRIYQREQTGSLPDSTYRVLAAYLEIDLAQTEVMPTLVIHYYPGVDGCNSTGLSSRGYIGAMYKRYRAALRRLGQVEHFDFYADPSGIDRWNMHRRYMPDQDGLLAGLFFPAHFPCSSFVVIFPDQTYQSYFGEYGMDYPVEVIEAYRKED